MKRIRPDVLKRARELRTQGTFPEKLLWSRLRAGQLGGTKFKRQHPIGRFVVDFYCPQAGLIVELDGESHIGMERHDQDRELWLKGRGLRVMRYTNDEILEDIDAVVDDIARQAQIPP